MKLKEKDESLSKNINNLQINKYTKITNNIK